MPTTTSPSSPRLEIPQKMVAPRGGRSGGGLFLYVLILVVIGLQTWSLLSDRQGIESVVSEYSPASVQFDRKVAMKLEDRNLPAAAIDAWEGYLAGVSLKPGDEAAIRYRMGKLLQQDQRYQEAVGAFYYAEQLLGDDGGDLPRQITIRVRECLQKLGQYSDLTREMADRADLSGDDTSMQSRQVVAQIGDEKITVSQFDRMLTEQIEQLIAMQGGARGEAADAIRKQAHGQFADPQAKMEQLQQFVASRVLADEARRRGLEDSDVFRRQLTDFADRMLASQLMMEEVGKRAGVTDQDVERYYAANKNEYDDAAEALISHILCADEEVAREVIAKARAGGDFAELAGEYSQDERTKNEGGVVRRAVSEDEKIVPGIGAIAELHAAIMSAEEGSVLAEPFESDRGWHVVKVRGRRDRRESSLEEVVEQVRRDVSSARRGEVSEQYIRELLDERKVKFYPRAFVDDRADDGSQSDD